MTAMDAMHRKVLLTEDIRSLTFTRMLDGFIDSARGTADVLGVSGTRAFPNGRSGADEARDMTRVLDVAETYYVAPRMVEVAIAASESMPDEPLLPHDLPSDHGFVWFAVPFRVIDIRGRVVSLNAALWAARGGRVRLWALTDKDDPVDAGNVTLREQDPAVWRLMPHLSVAHVEHLVYGAELPRTMTWNTPLPPGARVEFTPLRGEDGSMQMTWATDVPMDIQQEPTIKRDDWAAFILTLWRLCQQSIADRHQEQPDRALRRRMRRANVPDRPVTVIALRRRSGHGDGSTEVEWSHRWVVRGHWRQQRVKDADGQWTTRAIYINPYVKGPEDRPLLVREHVYGLVR